jgi:DNA-binding SARP family transcriptional activator/Flp pilus assembly protein TadD
MTDTAVPVPRLELLGGFGFNASPSAPATGRKDRLLLSYLALNAGRPQPREKLCGLLWADRPEAQARASLRQSLSVLREAIGVTGLLIATRDWVSLDPARISVDALEFADRAGQPDHAAAAMALYRGPLLDGLEAPTPECDDWLRTERRRFEELAARLVEGCCNGSPDPAAAALARRLLDRDRLREPLYRALMRLLHAQDDRAAALRLYGECRQALEAELGITPELETEQLYRDILTGTASRAAAAATVAAGPAPAPGPDRPALAVVPFANLSGDATLAPLCEGLAEDIITGLGRFRQFLVIDRNSSQAIARLTEDSAEIGRRLGVGLVVQGSLKRAGLRLRVTVRLVSAPVRSQVWADDFDIEAADVPAMSDRISAAIVARLHNRVETSLIEESRRKPALAAYELLLRGVKHMRGYAPDDNRLALELIEQAVALDPDYALARAYLGFAQVVFHNYDAAPREILERARRLVEDAVLATPEDGRCQWLLGMVCGVAGDLAGEERHYQVAMAINPSDANVRSSYGLLMAQLGRAEEGIAMIREAMRLNPYHPEWYWIDLGSAFYAARRYEDALEAYRQRTRPLPWLMSRMAACHAQLGQMSEARALVAEILRQVPGFTIGGLRTGGWSTTDTAHFHEGMRRAGLPE